MGDGGYFGHVEESRTVVGSFVFGLDVGTAILFLNFVSFTSAHLQSAQLPYQVLSARHYLSADDGQPKT